MRYLLHSSFAAFAIAACGSSDPAPPALIHYVAAQEALADDDLDRAHQALQDLVQSASQRSSRWRKKPHTPPTLPRCARRSSRCPRN